MVDNWIKGFVNANAEVPMEKPENFQSKNLRKEETTKYRSLDKLTVYLLMSCVCYINYDHTYDQLHEASLFETTFLKTTTIYYAARMLPSSSGCVIKIL